MPAPETTAGRHDGVLLVPNDCLHRYLPQAPTVVLRPARRGSFLGRPSRKGRALELYENLDPTVARPHQSEVEQTLLGRAPAGTTRTGRRNRRGAPRTPRNASGCRWVSPSMPTPTRRCHRCRRAAALRGLVGFVAAAPWPRTPQSPPPGRSVSRCRDWRSGRSPYSTRIWPRSSPPPTSMPARSTSVPCATPSERSPRGCCHCRAVQSYVWRAAPRGRDSAQGGQRRRGHHAPHPRRRVRRHGRLHQPDAQGSGSTSSVRCSRTSVADHVDHHAGRRWVIKNVGDEVMFAAEHASDAARIALGLQEAARARTRSSRICGWVWRSAGPRPLRRSVRRGREHRRAADQRRPSRKRCWSTPNCRRHWWTTTGSSCARYAPSASAATPGCAPSPCARPRPALSLGPGRPAAPRGNRRRSARTHRGRAAPTSPTG